MIITLVFKKKRQFFRLKLGKIAENCDHNIDPRLGEFSPKVWLFTLGSCLKTAKVAKIVAQSSPKCPKVPKVPKVQK
jgi:hypothetical protein